MISLHPATKAPERVALTAPLGVRFFDTATGGPVGEGLRAVAWPVAAPRQRVATVVNRRGVHAFHGLPGMRAFENTNTDDPWTPPPAAREFRVEVSDTLGRFLPCAFPASAPTRGAFTFNGGVVPLFSAPWRILPAAAVVRADLRDAATGRPAAWALAEVAFSSGAIRQTARGLADDTGQLALFFPWPEAQRGGNGGPPPPATGLPQQQWTLALTFSFAPTATPESAADFSARLAQPAVTASRDGAPLAGPTLRFGHELNLGTIALATV